MVGGLRLAKSQTSFLVYKHFGSVIVDGLIFFSYLCNATGRSNTQGKR